jgi:exodeoxyribonuclease V beta subunit
MSGARTLQAESVELSGTAVVEASAGTGKTFTITSLFLRLLLEQGLEVDQILVVTYTRAATAELRDRIRARLRVALEAARGGRCEDEFVSALCERVARGCPRPQLVAALERALANVDQAPVLTIHGFCQRVLRDHAFESGAGFGLTLTSYAAPIFEEIAADYFTAQLFDADILRAKLLYEEADVLRTLAARHAGAHALRVIPEPFVGGLSDEAWRRAHAACRELWKAERERVVAELSRLKGMQKNHLASWPSQMDELLATGEPGFSSGKFARGFLWFTREDARDKGDPAHPFFDLAQRLREEEERLCAAMLREKVAFRAGFLRFLDAELERRARDDELRTFDGLVTDLARALRGERAAPLIAALRKSYRAALVDEFQDTDPTQYEVFQRIFGDGDHPLLLIGDPKQAIYGFRGADVQAYLEARRRAGERVFTLVVNRRADPPLIAALNRLYAGVERPFLVDGIDYLPVSAPAGASPNFVPADGRAPIDLMLVEGPATEEALRREIAGRVARDIAALLASGARRRDPREGHGERALAAHDIAVLCRRNVEAQEVQQALSELGVPSVLSGDASVFDSEDAEHIERLLAALAHPADPAAVRSFLCSIYGGFDAEQLLVLDQDDAAWDRHARALHELHELFVARGFTQAVRGLCASYRVEERLLGRPDGMRRITNLNHLCELLAEAALNERLGPLGVLRWLESARNDAATRAELTAGSHELRLESSETAVQLTTVHKSKGLEYPIVYCPFLYRAATLQGDDKTLVRFHDPEAHGALTLDLGSEQQAEHLEIAKREALSEALRLLYVALTRAKHRVCLVLSAHKPSADSALVFTLLGGAGKTQVTARLERAGGLEAALTALAADSEGAISLRKLDARGAPPPRSLEAPPETLLARPIRRVLDAGRRTASFSALVAGRSQAQDSAHFDDLAAQSQGDDLAPARAAREPGPDSSLALDEFPRGAGPGQLIHEVLEHCAFDDPEQRWRASAAQLLKARGFDERLLDGLSRGIAQMLATPLDASGLRLSSVAAQRRLNELEFLFPVHAPLSARSLARVFRAHAAPAADKHYARRVEELSFETLRGFLRGFIDLVFQHEGRFYLVDYKSNRLGASAADYDQPALVRAMAEHHYFLQYHLYTLALHRHLRTRVAGYAYERHFGGAFYLFLRGMSPEHPPGTGVFCDLPSASLIDALDRCMGEPRAEQRP